MWADGNEGDVDIEEDVLDETRERARCKSLRRFTGDARCSHGKQPGLNTVQDPTRTFEYLYALHGDNRDRCAEDGDLQKPQSRYDMRRLDSVNLTTDPRVAIPAIPSSLSVDHSHGLVRPPS